MDKITTGLWWMVSSSKDSKKISASILGLAGFIPTILILQNFLGYNVLSAEDLKVIISELNTVVLAFFGFVTGAYAFFGLVRKAYFRVKNTFSAS